MILHILAKVGSLFLMLAIGALARVKKVITSDSLDSLSRVVLNVTLPFLFIYVLATKCSQDALLSLWAAPLVAMGMVFIGYIVGKTSAAALGLSGKRRDTFTLLVSFQNCTFLAIPLALLLFGEEGVFAIIIFNIGFNILYWTFGVWLLKKSGYIHNVHPFKNLLNPGIAALALGVLFGVFGIKLPPFFLESSKILGDATIPLAMLVIGAILATGEFRKGAGLNEMAVLVFCKLILIPLIFLGLVACLKGITGPMRPIIILQASMPSASTSPLLAKEFGGDYDLAASGVFYTTLFSIITIPIFMSLI